MTTPPYRIETDRLVIRCWEPTDAPLLKDAVDSSLDHLREWMPWAYDDPAPLSAKVALLRTFRGNFDLDTEYVYGIFDRSESMALGGTGYHLRREPGSFEIGYWLRTSATGNGFATEAAAVLTRIGFEICGRDRLELQVEPGNHSSEAIPRRLGYTREALLRRRLEARDGPRRDTIVYSMFADEVDPVAIHPAAFMAYDAGGNPITV